VFLLLASNYDDRFRNHGFLMRAPGRWALSPAYDLNPLPEIDRARTPKTAIIEVLRLLSVPAGRGRTVSNCFRCLEGLLCHKIMVTESCGSPACLLPHDSVVMAFFADTTSTIVSLTRTPSSLVSSMHASRRNGLRPRPGRRSGSGGAVP
jgi:hypothetical protein